MGSPATKNLSLPSWPGALAPGRDYSAQDLQRLAKRAGRPFARSLARLEDIRRVIDSYGYQAEWRENYRIQSVSASLAASEITCIDAALLSYGLLERFFPTVPRKLLAIHRRDQQGEECGHCVALYWGPDGRVGSFSKSSYPGLDHREAVFANEAAVATSYAEAYLRMQIQPLYFGFTTPEEAVPELDWRFSPDNLELLSERLKESYQYGFECAT
jgi:hypothetical protein